MYLHTQVLHTFVFVGLPLLTHLNLSHNQVNILRGSPVILEPCLPDANADPNPNPNPDSDPIIIPIPIPIPMI